MKIVVHRSHTRVSGSGFPVLVWGALGVLALFLFVAELLTTTRMVVFGRTVEGRIVDLESRRGITYLTVEYPTDDGEVTSSRGGFNGRQLQALAVALGGGEGDASVESLIGATVPVRYVPARPTMAHIARWVPLYRELVIGHLVWAVFAGAAVFTYRQRRRG